MITSFQVHPSIFSSCLSNSGLWGSGAYRHQPITGRTPHHLQLLAIWKLQFISSLYWTGAGKPHSDTGRTYKQTRILVPEVYGNSATHCTAPSFKAIIYINIYSFDKCVD